MILPALAPLLLLLGPLALAQTTTIPIFGLDDRGSGNNVYTVIINWSGSILAVNSTATTFVVTSTLVQHVTPVYQGVTARWTYYSTIGIPQTITQGPSTYEYTTSYGNKGMEDVTACRLFGTTEARCNFTGASWYGTHDTKSFTWKANQTDKDGFWGHFAPVTVSGGLEKIGASVSATGIATRTSTGAFSEPVKTGEAAGRMTKLELAAFSAILTIVFVY
ncbi:hypothetical protein BU16DRAFT_163146 [Lophium mytilinum]|uniref:Uncharacterized protein n=1 Tax=Lophium mytilinum TaxID=390894 RepID=A0A6A6QB47_9PEZI|nr:hypothetical protein BU16DRAFT_163146 [Lophium mytilinum]